MKSRQVDEPNNHEEALTPQENEHVLEAERLLEATKSIFDKVDRNIDFINSDSDINEKKKRFAKKPKFFKRIKDSLIGSSTSFLYDYWQTANKEKIKNKLILFWMKD